MGLPNWRIEIVKQLGAEVWSNDYLTDLVAMDDAADLGEILLAMERNLHQGVVQFLYSRISSTIKGDRTFRHVPHNVTGNGAIADYLPLYCTLRVDLTTADSDPGRKYYRMPIREVDQSNGVLAPADIAVFQAAVNAIDATVFGPALLVTPKGNPITGGTIFARIQERQLHRRKRPKMTQAQFDAQ